MAPLRFRCWLTEDRKMIDSGGTPMMISGFFKSFAPAIVQDKGVVMQSTGLLDKNGVEIFEGDIVAARFYPAWYERISWKGSPDAIAEVNWDYSGFGLKAIGEEDCRYPPMCELCLSKSEVIGNIYENPDLLPKAA